MSAARTKLVEKAAAAVSRGKYKRALDAYSELERLNPTDGAWARRCGEMLRHLDRKDEAVAAFSRSAVAYADAGFLVKAIAVCKLILRIDAGHAAAKERLAELTSERFAKPERREFASVGQRPETRPTIPSGQAIEEVRLRDTVPGAVAAEEDERITLIPIDESDFLEAPSEATELGAALRETALFEGLAAADLDILLEGVILRHVEAGETIFRQGDAGSELYVIDEGEVRVVAEASDGTTSELGRLGEGDFFGEIALVAETPRTATIEACSEAELLVLPRAVVTRLVESDQRVLTLLLRFLRDRLFARLTKTHQLLESFSPAERAELAGRFELLEVEDGAELIREGKPSKALYVLLAGTMKVDRGSRALATLEPGDVTGEMSLLTQEPAIASVTAATKAFVVRLPGSEFRQLIMTHPQVLAYIGNLVASRKEILARFESGADVSENIRVNLL